MKKQQYINHAKDFLNILLKHSTNAAFFLIIYPLLIIIAIIFATFLFYTLATSLN